MKFSIRLAAACVLLVGVAGVVAVSAASRTPQAPPTIIQQMKWSPDSRAACIVAVHGAGATGSTRISISVAYLDESDRLAMEQCDKDAALVGGESLQARAGAWTFEIPPPSGGWPGIESSEELFIYCTPH